MTMSMTPRRTRGAHQLIDYKEAEQMLRSGATVTAVAKHFGVSQSAVSLSIKRGNIKHDTGMERLLPWHMEREHINLAIPRGLRLAMRIQRGDGDKMPAYLKQQGEGFIRTLDEMDAVVHYDPDVPPFWFRVPRRPGIDKGLIREPDVE